MIATYRYKGETVNYTATKDIAYREVVELGERIGVAAADIATGETGTVNITGVYELLAAAAETFKTGETVYYKAEGVSKTKGGTEPVAGIVVSDKASSSTTALVKIG